MKSPKKKKKTGEDEGKGGLLAFSYVSLLRILEESYVEFKSTKSEKELRQLIIRNCSPFVIDAFHK